MDRITNTDELRARILELKQQKGEQEYLIMQDVYGIYDKLRPSKIFRTIFSEISTTPDILENIFSNIASIFGGYLSKRVFVRGSDNVFRRIMGTIAQFGVTYFIATHARQMKDKFSEIVQILFAEANAPEAEGNAKAGRNTGMEDTNDA